MKSVACRTILLSVLMITSSLAGCLGDGAEEPDEIVDPISVFGSVMVSTYHVGELVKAVAGDHVEMDYMSQDNIPVHDYEPSAADLIRLQEADAFFYHGLGLEPWVDDALSSLGDDAPPSFMTHTMPSGEITLDYQSMLIADLCELMNTGPFESTTLGMMSDDHGEDDHGEDDHGEDDHGEDDHGDDDHGDDDHGDDDHGDDDHGEDDHSEDDHGDDEMSPELALEFFDTNDDGFLSWEEFLASWEEDGDDDHDGHDDENEAEIPVLMEIFNESDTNMDDLLDVNELEDFIHEVMELGGDEHEGHEHSEAEKIIQNPGACPADTNIQVFHMEVGEHVLEFESEHDEDFNMAVLKMLGGHAHHDHGDHGDDHDDHDNDMVCYDMGTHTVDSTITTEEDCEAAGLMWTAANSGPGDEDHGEDHDGEYCHNTDTHENYYNVDETNCEAAGHVWMSDDDHDDHGDHGDEMCHNTDTHENYESTEEDCEAAGHMWMGHEGHDLPEIHADRVAHTLSFPIHVAGDWVDEWGTEHSIDSDSWNDNTITHYDNHEMWAVAQNSDDDAFSPGLWSKYDWTWESGELYYCQSTFAADTEADALSAESANGSDLAAGCGGFPWSLMEEAGHDDHDDGHDDDHDDGHDEGHDDDHVDHEGHHEIGAVIIHIEEEGDYGFALPNDIELFVIMGDGGHDDHDDHSDEEDDHDDHDDHSDEEDDHDDHDDHSDEEGEEAFDYDPHSWLDPLAFRQQANLVMMNLTQIFPDGADIFVDNYEAYSSLLIELDDRFQQAFGEQGTCVTEGFEKTIVANHNAYSYMSERYDIDILTVHGIDPEGEPSPAEVAEVVEHIKEEGITVLFIEEFTDQTAVQSIVEETGVEVQILYTMELHPSDSTDDYLSMMNKNIVNIVDGIGC